jgi:uncharacterized membrane protein YdjX (TVP38/TMEM64 family)
MAPPLTEPEAAGHRPAMSEPTPSVALTSAQRRVRLVKLGAVALVLAIGGLLVLRGYDVKGAFQQGLELVRSAGPLVFFLAMALLPALGVPQSAFIFTAGPLFGAQLGLPVVVLCALLAMLVNMILSYWLGSRVLRPVLEALFQRLGYKLPQVKTGDETDLIVLLRVTPGVPFPVQNYLLALARVRFVRYLGLSFLIQGPLTATFVVFGDALLQGKGKVAFLGLSVIVVLAVGTQLLRKHYAKKRV